MAFAKVNSALKMTLRNKHFWIMLAILSTGAWLRLTHIQTLFNPMADYDQGVYALDARLVTQGLMPYSDFVLVHPPLYILVLAAVYKVFGYSFLAGKYLSVVLSLSSIIVLYFIGKQLSKPTAGLTAAAIFAISPGMVFYGQRVSQESLGIFLTLLGLYFGLGNLTKHKLGWALAAGCCLGLAVAAKYTFFPALFGAAGMLALASLRTESIAALRRFFKPGPFIVYFALAACFVAVLMLVHATFAPSLPVPFIYEARISAENLVICAVVFIVPLFVTLNIFGEGMRFRYIWAQTVSLLKQKAIWGMFLGAAAAFLLVCVVFLSRAFPQFVAQTLTSQGSRDQVFPSLLTLAGNFVSAVGFTKAAILPVLLAFPLAFFFLNKPEVSRFGFALGAGIGAALVLCQFFPGTSRYYVSVFPFFIIGLALLTPADTGVFSSDVRKLPAATLAGLCVLVAVIMVFSASSITLMSKANYCEFDNPIVVPAPDAEAAYNETIDFLRSLSPNKVYSVDPIISALAPDIACPDNFDIFSSVALGNGSVDAFIRGQISAGVDYIVVSNSWNAGHADFSEGLLVIIAARAHLVKVINPDSPDSFAVYAVN